LVLPQVAAAKRCHNFRESYAGKRAVKKDAGELTESQICSVDNCDSSAIHRLFLLLGILFVVFFLLEFSARVHDSISNILKTV
jgi:hypothetical protein